MPRLPNNQNHKVTLILSAEITTADADTAISIEDAEGRLCRLLKKVLTAGDGFDPLVDPLIAVHVEDVVPVALPAEHYSEITQAVLAESRAFVEEKLAAGWTKAEFAAALKRLLEEEAPAEEEAEPNYKYRKVLGLDPADLSEEQQLAMATCDYILAAMQDNVWHGPLSLYEHALTLYRERRPGQTDPRRQDFQEALETLADLELVSAAEEVEIDTSKRDNEALQTQLLCWSDLEVPIEKIAQIPDKDFRELVHYLVASMYEASDNNVIVPPKPAMLTRLEAEHSADNCSQEKS